MGTGNRIWWVIKAASVACIAMSSSVYAGECLDDQVFLRGEWGQARFTVEIADTAPERNLGLMNRESMATTSGMLFAYTAPQTVQFWMKDTLIPLDIIFLNKSGVVERIRHNAVPLSYTKIFGGNNIQYVLEINGGLANSMGIDVGTQLQHPIISEEFSKWPC